MYYRRTVLEICNLCVSITSQGGTFHAVDDVSFKLYEGEILCLVGESGCGKTLTILSIMKLFTDMEHVKLSGDIKFLGESLAQKTEKELCDIRGSQMAMIFQEPMSSLNPVHMVGRQISESIMLHLKASKASAQEMSISLLNEVGIPDPRRVLSRYPHQLSGGMRQRVMIAMAASCNPTLLIADEPTTALDVTTQAQVLEIIKTMRANGKAIIFVTHDLGVVAEVADKVAVMYAGKIVEESDVFDFFNHPLHPYSKGLLEARVPLDNAGDRLSMIKGEVPNPSSKPVGCSFHPRCEIAVEKCFSEAPNLHKVGNRLVRCLRQVDLQ